MGTRNLDMQALFIVGASGPFVDVRSGMAMESLPFSIWMLSGYFNGIPRELDDAAKVDGCSPLGALIRVILPAARPGLVAVAIYSFMTAWGEVLFASVMTTDANRTLYLQSSRCFLL